MRRLIASPPETAGPEYYREPAVAVAQQLRTDPVRGLSADEVAERRARYGPNVIELRQRWFLPAIARRLTNLLTLILLAAVAISWTTDERGDAIIIAVVVVFDLILGLTYESVTKYKIALLRKQVPRVTEVVRDGQTLLLPAEEIVPGDIVVVRAGERVPADLRLARVVGFRVDESALTGEPGDQTKETRALAVPAAVADQRNMVFAGTTATTGHAHGIAVATGARSMLGKLAHRVVAAGWQVTPLELRLRRLGRGLGFGIVVVAAFLFAIGLFRGETASTMFRTALTLAVAAIPEGLTIILTIALAIGAVRLLRSRAVVRHLTAAETLGDATVVLTDKTGTLTTAELTLRRVESLTDTWARDGLKELAEHPVFRRALLGSVAGLEDLSVPGSRGSAIDRALRETVETVGIQTTAVRREFPLFQRLVFDARYRYQASLHDDPKRPEPVVFAVGAPDVLLPRCREAVTDSGARSLSADQRQELLGRAAEAAGEGTRVLAVCSRQLVRQRRDLTHDDIRDLTFLAFLHFDDPVRPDAAAAVRGLRAAGVRVVMTTGDHRGTAAAVAAKTGILDRRSTVLTGQDIEHLSDALLADQLSAAAVVARVDPLQKERLVTALQRRGDVVAMVGDGVNDAVALRRADLGVAVATATDVAKDASDLVLLDGGLSALNAAVAEGRRIRETVRTVLAFLFATNIVEVLAVAISLAGGLPLPFLAAQLLWINLVTDGVADAALALEPAATRQGDKTPGRKRGIFRSYDLVSMAMAAVAVLIPTMLVYFAALGTDRPLAFAQTMAFVTLASSQLFAAFSFRSLERPLLLLLPSVNVWLVGAVAGSFGLLFAAVHWPPLASLLGTVPLSRGEWTVALVAAGIGFLGVEARKALVPLFRASAFRRPEEPTATKDLAPATHLSS